MAISIPGYRFLSKVASGSSGTVYRAVQEDLGRVVAVKVLAPGLFGEQETLARFVREAKLQARLTHPSVVELYDAGVAGRHPYLVTEFVGGGSLRELLAKEGALPLGEVLRIGGEIALGLAHAHQAGIVHRDLKPDNILFTTERAAKIADFGLAKNRAGSQTVQTATGAILGTPGYLAPEVIQGSEAGPRADLYALGVMLHEMATGERAFGGEDFGEILQAQLHEDLPPLTQLRSGTPPELSNLVQACTSRMADARPRSAAAVAEKLSAIEGQGVTTGSLSGLRAARTLQLDGSGSGMARAVETASAGKRPSIGSAQAARPRERQTTVTGAVGGSSGTVVAARGGVPRAWPSPTVLVGATALVAVLAAGLAFRGRGPAPGSERPVSPGPTMPTVGRTLRVSRPVRLAGRLLPMTAETGEVAWVSAAADRLCVRLRAATKRPLTVTWRSEAAGRANKTEIPPGTLNFPITNLQSGRNYQVWVGGKGQRSWRGSVRTLVPHGQQGLVELWQGPSAPNWFDAVCGESTVLGFRYRERGDPEVWRVVCLASPDDGKSWVQTDRPVEPDSISGGLALAPVPGGTLAAWFGFVPGGSMRLATALLATGSTRWTTGACTEPGWSGHNEGLAVASAGGDGVDVLACVTGGQPWAHAACWTRVRQGDPSPLRLKPAFELPEHSWFRLGRAGSRLVAIVHQPARGDRPSRNLWTSTDRPDQTPWPPLQPLTGPGDKAEWVDLNSGGDRVVVSYEDSVTGWARILASGSSSFGKPLPFGGTWQRMYSPSAAAAEGRTSLAYITWEVLGACYLMVLDGGLGPPWKQKAQLSLLGVAPSHLYLRAGPRSLQAFVTDNNGRLLATALPR